MAIPAAALYDRKKTITRLEGDGEVTAWVYEYAHPEQIVDRPKVSGESSGPQRHPYDLLTDPESSRTRPRWILSLKWARLSGSCAGWVRGPVWWSRL